MEEEKKINAAAHTRTAFSLISPQISGFDSAAAGAVVAVAVDAAAAARVRALFLTDRCLLIFSFSCSLVNDRWRESKQDVTLSVTHFVLHKYQPTILGLLYEPKKNNTTEAGVSGCSATEQEVGNWSLLQ